MRLIADWRCSRRLPLGIVSAVAALTLLAAWVGSSLAASSASPGGVKGATRTDQSRAGGTLVIAVPHDVETLDPDFSHYPLANEVNYNLHDQYFIYGMQSAGTYTVEDVTKIKPKSIA